MFRSYSSPYQNGRRQSYNNTQNQGTKPVMQPASGSEHREGMISYNQYDAGAAPAASVSRSVSPVKPTRSYVDLSDPLIREYWKLNPRTGYLKMKVFTQRDTLPVENAKITVYKINDGTWYTIAMEQTNTDGQTVAIPLPCPDKSLTFNPRNPRPYSRYNILVQHPGYENIEIKNVPIFDGIMSLKSINMMDYTK